ncbi:MAG: cupin domain-containing protein [Acidimicrobiales bacterium]|nr:cupin domain-containing protein [Acidimicrobiales bacterium]
MTLDTPQVITRDAGDHFHFLNQLAVNKVAGDDSGTMTVVEFYSPAGFAPPVHSHRYEDELVVMLDGEIDFLVGDERTTARTGELAYLPHGVPHSFVVQSDHARYLSITTARSRVPEFDAFIADMGSPAPTAELPEEAPIDGALVADVARSHDIDILGPPPA